MIYSQKRTGTGNRQENLIVTLMKVLYSIWCWCCFLIPYIIFTPFQQLFLCFQFTKHIAHWLNQAWAHITLPLCGLGPKTIIEESLPNQPVVYCVNHTSYLDIPSLFYSIPNFFTIIGKHELTKIPLFGRMFSKLYITVKRTNRSNKYASLQQAHKAIAQNRSVIIFPEGKIDKTISPKLLPFHNGAFRLAIQEQIPIVPVTIPYNWIILPDGAKWLRRKKMKIIIHRPILTKKMNMNDIETLKSQVREKIENTLSQMNEEMLSKY